MDAWQVVSIAVVIVCGLVGVIYYAGQNRDDKQDARAERNEQRMERHVTEDVAAHERLRAVETEVTNLKAEVAGLRQRWHDLRSEITHTLATWYSDIMERLRK